MNQDTEWALSEGSLFFEGRGRVQEMLRRITARLEQLGIPYAVADRFGMHNESEFLDLGNTTRQ